jgi:hypothetical protein
LTPFLSKVVVIFAIYLIFFSSAFYIFERHEKTSKVTTQIIFANCKSPNSLAHSEPFRYRKSTIFLGVPFRLIAPSFKTPFSALLWQSGLNFGCRWVTFKIIRSDPRWVRPNYFKSTNSNFSNLSHYFVGKKLCICDLLTPAFDARLVTYIFLGDVTWKILALGLKQAWWLFAESFIGN